MNFLNRSCKYYLKWEDVLRTQDAQTLKRLLFFRIFKKKYIEKILKAFEDVQKTKEHLYNTYAYKGSSGSKIAAETESLGQDFGDYKIVTQVAKHYSLNPRIVEKWKLEDVLTDYALVLWEHRKDAEHMDSINKKK